MPGNSDSLEAKGEITPAEPRRPRVVRASVKVERPGQQPPESNKFLEDIKGFFEVKPENNPIIHPTVPWADAYLGDKIKVAIADEKGVTVSPTEINRLKANLLADGRIQKSTVEDMDSNEIVAAYQIFRQNVSVEEPLGSDFDYPLNNPSRQAEEATAKVLMSKAVSTDEEVLTPEKIGKYMTVESMGKASTEGGPGTMGLISPDWDADLPSSLTTSAELGPFVDELKMLKGSIGVNYHEAQKDLDALRDLFRQRFVDGKLGGNPEDQNKIRKAMDLAREEIARRAKEDIDKRVEAGGMDDEFRESQYIYYGMTTMPKVRNLGAPESLLHQEGFADKAVKELIKAGDLSQAELEKIRGLSVDDLAKFEENNSDEITKNKGVQKKIYDALKTDQEIWLHKKIESLAWENLDVSRLGNNLAYKEFSNAQYEMLPEVEEYARGISRGSELKYAFTKSGMEAMISNSSVLKETLEVLVEKVHGWNEIVAETERFITREKKSDEDRVLPGLRKKYKSNPSSVTADEMKYLKETAEGLYVYEENADGSVKHMRPKTSAEIKMDQQILSEEEEWKVGGFVRFKSEKDVAKMREHLFKFAKAHLEKKAEEGVFTKEEVKARAKIAAFMGEWVFWRMKGRSAYWGEQGGDKSAAGGGRGENDLFYVVGYQHFITQEAKGNGETGRVVRKLAVGADTLESYLEKYVPGMAGGVNFNLGFLDFYSQYTGFFPGERANKPMQDAGFIRGFGEGQKNKIDRINRFMNDIQNMKNSGIDNDEAWKTVRKRMTDDDKDFLEENNNLPIVTLANTTSREALANMASGKSRNPYGDAPDWYGGDYQGPNKIKQLMNEPDTGFLSRPDARMLGAAAKLSEGRKRVWQRAKLMKDMASMLLDFKSLWNKKITGRDDWNAENADTFLTDAREEGLIVNRTKKQLERDYYRKVVGKGLARLIPFADNPFMHKLSFIYAKKPGNIALDTILAMILEFLKKFPSQMQIGSR